MTRSGSTLAFETKKAILEKYGMPQQKINFEGLGSWIENYLPEKYLNDIDSLEKINQKTLTNFVVFKTHGAANKKLIEFIRKFNIPVTISVRDPKDIAISLLEISNVGVVAAELPRALAFSSQSYGPKWAGTHRNSPELTRNYP